MTTILDRIIAHKRIEIEQIPDISESELTKSDRDFVSAIRKKGKIPALIAEIKPKSPAKGAVLPADFSVAHLAKTLEDGGAAAISVLTDAHFFGGSFENLRLAESATQSIPLLCKDFILSRQQIRSARFFGADSFLLIAKVLSRQELSDLLEYGRKWNMEALVEIADDEDLEKIQNLGARVVGINNRDLRDFSVNLGRTFSLAKKLPRDVLVASLSGFSGADVRLVRGLASAVLVGSSIGKSSNISAKLSEFIRPNLLKKFCGVRNFSDFLSAQNCGVQIFGLNFVDHSRRKISESEAHEIAKNKGESRLFGVFQNASRDFCAAKCTEFHLDFCQLHGNENPADFLDFPFPLVRAISLSDSKTAQSEMEAWENIADLWLFDGRNPGSGTPFDFAVFEEIHSKITKPFLIAGGITPENFAEMANLTSADGIDTASGIENGEGEWDMEKIGKIIISSK